MAIPELLRDLLLAAGPSGREQAPAAVFRAACEGFAEVSSDTVGSLVARVPGRGDGPRVAVFGHIDEIGLIVTHVDDKGLLWFQSVGGWDPIILVGQRVEVMTRRGSVPGVVGRKPIHLIQTDEREKAPKLRDLHIDVGAADADEARALVEIGDVAVIAAEPVELPNGRIASRALDNRLGTYVAAEALRRIAEAGGAAGEAVAVAVVQEETTFGGSHTSAYSVAPDVAIVVDVTHATDQPGAEERELGRHELGSGPTVSRGSSLSPMVSDLLLEAARDEAIPYTVEGVGRWTGTDADAVFISRAGVPTGVVGIPLRYMHSPVEVVQLSDVEACVQLVAAFALRLTAETSFLR